MNKFKRELLVLVTTGKDKGKIGKIKKVLLNKSQLIVDGINIYKRHKKSSGTSDSSDSKGQIVDIEMPIHWSNVRLVTGENKVVKVSFKVEDNKKVRFDTKTKEIIG